MYLAFAVVVFICILTRGSTSARQSNLLPVHSATFQGNSSAEKEKQRDEALKKARLRQQLAHWSAGNKKARQESSNSGTGSNVLGSGSSIKGARKL